MKIIAQKNSALNTYDFFNNALTKDYIDAISFNIAYTKDNKVVIFNNNPVGIAVTTTINSSTLGQLQGYEIILLDDVLEKLNKAPIKKELYINLSPYNFGVLSDKNINETTKIINSYIDEVKKITSKYTNLNIKFHSTSRRLINVLSEKIPTSKIGFAITGNDLTFIDVDYYVLVSNTQNDNIIDMLLKNKKEVIIYVYSEYYITYLYDHYLGEKSTPLLNQTIQKLSIMSNYPVIIDKMFN